MRKVVVYMLTSLDGVAEEPSDWMTDFDEPIFSNLSRIIRAQDTILLGRGTYDYWVDYWPSDGGEPFHSFINGTEKHVFTSRPLDREWSNTVVIDGPADHHVRALRQGDGGDIGVHGSIRLARSLGAAGLVDEYRLVVASTIAGRGERLFSAADPKRQLALIEATTTPGGSLLLGYRAVNRP